MVQLEETYHPIQNTSMSPTNQYNNHIRTKQNTTLHIIRFAQSNLYNSQTANEHNELALAARIE